MLASVMSAAGFTESAVGSDGIFTVIFFLVDLEGLDGLGAVAAADVFLESFVVGFA